MRDFLLTLQTCQKKTGATEKKSARSTRLKKPSGLAWPKEAARPVRLKTGVDPGFSRGGYGFSKQFSILIWELYFEKIFTFGAHSHSKLVYIGAIKLVYIGGCQSKMDISKKYKEEPFGSSWGESLKSKWSTPPPPKKSAPDWKISTPDQRDWE